MKKVEIGMPFCYKGFMERLAQDTPDPLWLTDLDEQCQLHLERLTKLPVLEDLRKGKTDSDRRRNFLLQVGFGIISSFPTWLDDMLERVEDRESTIYKYLRSNRMEEHHHWQWWMDMSEAYGVKADEFEDVTLAPQMRILYDHLTEASKNRPLTLAMTGVNYVVETAAAIMTASVAKEVISELGEDSKAARWVIAHAEADVVHSANARELIKGLVYDRPEVWREVKGEAKIVYDLFEKALREAY